MEPSKSLTFKYNAFSPAFRRRMFLLTTLLIMMFWILVFNIGGINVLFAIDNYVHGSLPISPFFAFIITDLYGNFSSGTTFTAFP